jgi:hypothetical protein
MRNFGLRVAKSNFQSGCCNLKKFTGESLMKIGRYRRL